MIYNTVDALKPELRYGNINGVDYKVTSGWLVVLANKVQYLQTYILAVLFNVLIIANANGQAPSLTGYKDTSAANRKSTYVLKLNGNNSRFNNTPANFVGARAGYDLHRKHEIGIGFQFLASRNLDNLSLPIDVIAQNAGAAGNQDFFSKPRLWYVEGYYEPAIYSPKRLVFSLPIGVGMGKLGYIRHSHRDKFAEGVFAQETIYALNLGGNIEYRFRFFPYAGLAVGGGYRYIMNTHQRYLPQFSAPFYSVKLKIYLSEIYKRVILHQKPKAS